MKKVLKCNKKKRNGKKCNATLIFSGENQKGKKIYYCKDCGEYYDEDEIKEK